MKRDVEYWMRAAADMILPRVCIVCGRRLLLNERYLCLGCAADMPFTRFETISHNPMADRFNEIIQRHLSSDNHSVAEVQPCERYAYASALFLYKEDSGYKRIPYQVKYHGNIAVGRYFGGLLGRRLAGSPLFEDVDMVIPVPLHRLRRWKRGYNQAEVIAAEVADALGVPLRTDILVRGRRTRTQTQLSIEEKAANVAGAFEVSESAKRVYGITPHDDSSRCIRPKHVLLVDDVFTTGSTLGECFWALRSVFPPEVRISVAALAFVGGA